MCGRLGVIRPRGTSERTDHPRMRTRACALRSVRARRVGLPQETLLLRQELRVRSQEFSRMQQIPPAPQHEHRDERRAHDRDGPRPRLLSRLRSGSGLLRHGSYADRTMGAARADDPVLESRLSALGAACGHHRSRADRALRGSPARAWARRAARGRRRPSAGSGAHPHGHACSLREAQRGIRAVLSLLRALNSCGASYVLPDPLRFWSGPN